MAAEFAQLTGQNGGHIETLLSMARLLDKMAQDPDAIPGWLSEYRDNIGALGTWVIKTKEQPLQIDYIVGGLARDADAPGGTHHLSDGLA